MQNEKKDKKEYKLEIVFCGTGMTANFYKDGIKQKPTFMASEPINSVVSKLLEFQKINQTKYKEMLSLVHGNKKMPSINTLMPTFSFQIESSGMLFGTQFCEHSEFDKNLKEFFAGLGMPENIWFKGPFFVNKKEEAMAN